MKLIYILLIIFSGLFLSGCSKCINSHEELRYQQPWTQFIWSGKIMIPIFHPGYYYKANVCDQWEEKK